MMRRFSRLALIFVLAGAACQGSSQGATPRRTSPSVAPTSVSEAEGDLGEGSDEEGRDDTDRVDRVGVAVPMGPIRHRSVRGWRHATMFGAGNDWEPAAAADPHAPFVYVVTTRYSGPGPLPCPSCDLPAIALKVSSDDGRTFGRVRFLPVDARGGQYDPQIVTDAAGDVFASWIDGPGDIVFSKSTDHGARWSDPEVVSAPAPWGDHPWLGVSPNGRHVYMGFNHADTWIAQSHDGGITWLPAQQVSDDARFHFANGTVVGNDGSVAVSTAGYPQGGGRRSRVLMTVVSSTDGGSTFRSTRVDTVEQARACRSQGCPADHYGGHAALARSGSSILLAYDGATRTGGDQYVWVRRSTDWGRTWTARERLSHRRAGSVAMNPAVAAAPDGEFRIAWQASPRGQTRWNTIVRVSHDDGQSWLRPTDVSDATSGYGYLHPAGYGADYGDYMEVTITDGDKTFAVWGSGFGYAGPGGTWFNRQR